jgi:serine/threonine protein kinase
MVQCPKCSAQIPLESKFCLSCGQPISTLSQMPTAAGTAAEPAKAPAETPHVARIISSDSIPAGGFTPGTILADRYRIIGLLGRGGMGEVYRADDLKLGQPVALKFLPPKLADDPVRRERFFAEVRITRQLSHPNICRVYDIQEIEGRHFLSMEFIDGEDLASLLRRIGHLSNEKALDIARQLAAGLAAAHERGVLHRDLKPANIMLDGHGRVRITDFGLAIAVGEETQTVEIAGTPAYMAPEQLAGKGATVRSDIYSLGLVLYEIYTGKKAFTATTIAELREQKENHTPRAISELREGMDPVVERLIRRCMERDPNARPASVAQLALALPGGDPLAAALAAGETPSPEMVAASGSKEGLRPAIAWGLLAFITVGTLAILVMNDRFSLHRRIPFEKSPEALVELSRQFLHKVGYTEKFSDSAHGFIVNSNVLRYMTNSDKTTSRWKSLDAKAILFWYRQSPRPFDVPVATLFQGSDVTITTPPLKFSQEVLVLLDTEGRLVSLRAVPPQVQSSSEAASAPDWKTLFTEAGLDISKWKPTEAKWSPLSYADSRAAWQGSLLNLPGTPVEIEAAAFQGKPVSFEVIGPWTRAAQMEPFQQAGLQIWVLNLSLITLIGGGIVFARRNLRLGRGDRRNATRLALVVLGLQILTITFAMHHVPSFREMDLFISSVSISLFLAGLFWVLYIAIEPFVRRRWPQILVSWTRLLSGDLRDPLVMRDAFVGCAFGVFVACILRCGSLFLPPSWLGNAAINQRYFFAFGAVLGTRFFISELLGSLSFGIIYSLGLIALLFLIRAVLRNQKAAIAVSILVWALFTAGLGFPISLVLGALYLFVLIRFGLVAAALDTFTMNVLISVPTTLDVSAWYSGYGFAALAVFAAIVFYAFRYSLGSRPLLSASHLDD